MDKLKTGTGLSPLVKGPLTSSHIARWCAAQENWDKIHYDLDYARNVAKLPYTIINGALKQHLLVQFLAAGFEQGAWIWRLDYRFTGMDLVGQTLRIEGTVRDIDRRDGFAFVKVDLHIRNVEQGGMTTVGAAVVVSSETGAPVLDGLALLKQRVATQRAGQSDDPGVPKAVKQRIGTELSQVTSYCPVELGRLRLFAEAVMDIPAIHYDQVAGAAGAHGTVVAPPLFPIHAMSQPPGTFELSSEATALGREGVCEVGRNVAQMFGLPPHGLLNGGNKVQVHSLVKVGETVRASSRLVAACHRKGRRGGEMLIYDTENEYETTTGRPLLTEHQSMVQRLEP